MAKTNKYSSINFNHILEKNPTSNSKSKITNSNSTKNPSSSFASATYSSISSKTHGRMLVLTRPTPKPISSQIPPPSTHHQIPDQTTPTRSQSQPDSDTISLRPLGRTGAGSIVVPFTEKEKEKEEIFPVVNLHKPEKFVPPHLRAGFVGKEDRPVTVGIRPREAGQRQHGHFGSHGRYEEDRRPKSGGGYERMRFNGNRPNSSG